MEPRQMQTGTMSRTDGEPIRKIPPPFRRAPAVALGAALFFGGIFNFTFPFASFGRNKAVGGGEPAMISNNSSLPEFDFPVGVCKVDGPKDGFKPTMNIQRAKE